MSTIRSLTAFPVVLLALVIWQVGCGKTDAPPSNRPTAPVQESSPGVTKLDTPARMAEAPSDIANLVLVGNDQPAARFPHSRESGGVMFSPFSGGIVAKDFLEARLMRSDGQPQGTLQIGGTAFRGFADPHSGRFLLISEQPRKVREVVYPGLLSQPHSLDVSSPSQLQTE